MVVVRGRETRLPATPLKTWRRHRAISRVQVRNIRDEPYRTPRGESIGVRFTFDVVFPETGVYFVYTTVLLGADPDTPYDLIFDHSLPLATPSPAPRKARGAPVGAVFDRDLVYTFTVDSLPNFVEYYDPTKSPSVRFPVRKTFSEKDFLKALSGRRPMRYRTDIEVSDPDYSGDRFVAARHLTAHPYDLQAIYQTVMKQGGGRCETFSTGAR